MLELFLCSHISSRCDKLVLTVEALEKYRSSTTTKSVAKEGFAKDLTSMNPSDTKTTPKHQVKSEVHKPQQESTSKSRRCFKCQGLGDIAYKCPNWKVVALSRKMKPRKKIMERQLNMTM